jgi:hypothetical protein
MNSDSSVSTSDILVQFGFLPPTHPWSTNEDRNLHHFTRADRIQTWKGDTRIHYAHTRGKAGTRIPPGIVQVTIPFTSNRRRDPHNYCGTVVKAVIDGLVLAGAWPDDTPEWVGHREPILYKGDRVIVTVFPQPAEG